MFVLIAAGRNETGYMAIIRSIVAGDHMTDFIKTWRSNGDHADKDEMPDRPPDPIKPVPDELRGMTPYHEKYEEYYGTTKRHIEDAVLDRIANELGDDRTIQNG
jgi:hypothetical protein